MFTLERHNCHWCLQVTSDLILLKFILTGRSRMLGSLHRPLRWVGTTSLEWGDRDVSGSSGHEGGTCRTVRCQATPILHTTLPHIWELWWLSMLAWIQVPSNSNDQVCGLTNFTYSIWLKLAKMLLQKSRWNKGRIARWICGCDIFTTHVRLSDTCCFNSLPRSTENCFEFLLRGSICSTWTMTRSTL